MIGHSFLTDGYGFPYISEYYYYYIAGYSDRALTCITIDDVGEQVKLLVEEVWCGNVIVIALERTTVQKSSLGHLGYAHQIYKIHLKGISPPKQCKRRVQCIFFFF